MGPLADRLATPADPRCRRGKRHPFVAVLLSACSAVVTGARSFTAINEWAGRRPAGRPGPARCPAAMTGTGKGIPIRLFPRP
ncbi:transposase family protein [Streptomyces sp. NPDC001832]|uniref:transposase family protein n=1 Tax=Streptomyces sp. NPDC001832 TaxID=3154527 RepID=UPI0033259E63